MSYLDAPRLCFRGSFMAEGPTCNNLLAAIDTVSRARWNNNPCATGAFRLVGDKGPVTMNQFGGKDCTPYTYHPTDDDVCTVLAAWDADGPAAAADGTLNQPVSGTGWMADLDPEHRRVTDLVGFSLKVGPRFTPLVQGAMTGMTQLRDFWQIDNLNVPAFPVSTSWQTVLAVGKDGWGDVSGSKVLSQLKDRSPAALSLRLTMTMFGVSDGGSLGTLLGVIGPYSAGEPEQIVAGRRLLSCPDGLPSAFPTANFVVDPARKKLVVDLGSLIPVSVNPDKVLQPADPILNRLEARILPENIPIAVPRDVTTGDWFRSAGIVEWDLDPAQLTLLGERRLRLKYWAAFHADPNADQPRFMEEHTTGKYVDVDRRSLRLDPGGSATVDVYAWRFGKPLPGEVVTFALYRQRAWDAVHSIVGLEDPDYPPDPFLIINSEPADVFDGGGPPFEVTTDASGRARLTIAVKDGPFTFPDLRKRIDSQIYFLGDPAGWQTWGALGPPVGAGCALSVLVFNTGPKVANPQWSDVSGILGRYAQLYPAMTQRINLGDRDTVTQYAVQIYDVLSLPIEDRESMPVTRDLSSYHRGLIKAYLETLPGFRQDRVAEEGQGGNGQG